MTEKEYHDLLIRLDANFQDIKEDVRDIKGRINGLQCQAHTERIKTLEKITWGAVMASIAAVVRSFWGSMTGQ